jgi:hypothetical protein
MITLFVSTALAFDVNARLAEVSTLRSQRLSKVVPTLSTEAYAKAAAGEVATGIEKVPGHEAKLGWGVGVINAPIEAVWAGINDETRHGDLLPLSHVEIVSGAACADRRQVLMVLPLPVIADRYWVNENRFASALATASNGQVRELTWSSVADPAAVTTSAAGKAAIDGLVPMTFNRGAWLLISLDADHTLAEYHSWVDPGGAVPAGAASTFATSGIVDTFRAMETYAKRGSLPCR